MTSTLQSKNSRNEIKISKGITHQIFHVDIMQAMSFNETQHKQRPAAMCHSMCMSTMQYRDRAATCTINQDLCDFGKRCRPTESDNGKMILLVDRPH